MKYDDGIQNDDQLITLGAGVYPGVVSAGWIPDAELGRVEFTSWAGLQDGQHINPCGEAQILYFMAPQGMRLMSVELTEPPCCKAAARIRGGMPRLSECRGKDSFTGIQLDLPAHSLSPCHRTDDRGTFLGPCLPGVLIPSRIMDAGNAKRAE